MKQPSPVLTHAITLILKPLIRLLLRNGIAFNALSELLKKLYVDVAESDFQLDGKKQSTSRIAILTGLNRKEVARARGLNDLDLSAMTQQFNRAARVVSGWVRDPDFHTTKGQVAELEPRDFDTLVKRYSGDIPLAAISDELLHVGAVKLLPNGKLKLLKNAYIPSNDTDEKLRILGTDVSDLIHTIEHNILNKSPALFQRKVAYNAIATEDMPLLKEQLHQRSQQYLEELDELLSRYDKDNNPDITGTETNRIGLGIYYFEETDND
ncbi:MAG: hypothetical protein COA90_08995 [Gammaproteobacteria bacterium]|nr:MAG: hypothetical protein COA90_08995 [Gammaproteobacteria bacterium]